MLTVDVLISVTNGKIVRVKDMLQPQRQGVRYIVSYQYTDEKFLKLVPKELEGLPDVVVVKNKALGVSQSRNVALKEATSDLIYFIDDDMRLLPESIDIIRKVFDEHPDVDIALFQAQNYSGECLRKYPTEDMPDPPVKELYKVLACETVCRREKVQGKMVYDVRFGLGSHCATCYEQQIWLTDAIKAGLKISFFANPIIQTSAIYKPLLYFVDRNVQCSIGSMLYYICRNRAYIKAFQFARYASKNHHCAFWPFFSAMVQGINQLKHTPKSR